MGSQGVDLPSLNTKIDSIQHADIIQQVTISDYSEAFYSIRIEVHSKVDIAVTVQEMSHER